MRHPCAVPGDRIRRLVTLSWEVSMPSVFLSLMHVSYM